LKGNTHRTELLGNLLLHHLLVTHDQYLEAAAAGMSESSSILLRVMQICNSLRKITAKYLGNITCI